MDGPLARSGIQLCTGNLASQFPVAYAIAQGIVKGQSPICPLRLVQSGAAGQVHSTSRLTQVLLGVLSFSGGRFAHTVAVRSAGVVSDNEFGEQAEGQGLAAEE